MTLTRKTRPIILAVGFLVALAAGIGGVFAAQRHFTLAGLDAAAIAYLVSVFGGVLIVVSTVQVRADLKRSIVMLNSGLLVIGVALNGLARHIGGDSAHWLELTAGLVFGAEAGLMLAYWIHRRSDAGERGRGGPHS
jgi:uncharacterized membrane protein